MVLGSWNWHLCSIQASSQFEENAFPSIWMELQVRGISFYSHRAADNFLSDVTVFPYLYCFCIHTLCLWIAWLWVPSCFPCYMPLLYPVSHLTSQLNLSSVNIPKHVLNMNGLRTSWNLLWTHWFISEYCFFFIIICFSSLYNNTLCDLQNLFMIL